jgi:hypothetical protein
MKLTKGEYCQFSLKSRLALLREFGVLVTERYVNNQAVRIFKIYDFYVEVLYDLLNNCFVKAEPVYSTNLMEYYLNEN